MDKALRWGVNSAACTDEPVLTVFILLAWRNRATHMNMLTHPLVQQAALIKRGRFNFTPATYTNMGERPSHHAHFDVQILVVSNAAGHAKYFNPQAWDTLEHALQAHGRHADGKPWELQWRRPTARTLAGPVSLHQLFTSRAPEEPHPDPPQLELPALPAASAICTA
jgi:hypothetical protein